MFPRPSLPGVGSEADGQYDSLLEAVFGCDEFSTAPSCGAKESCVWVLRNVTEQSSNASSTSSSSLTSGSEGTGARGSCRVDKESEAYKSYSYFDIQSRQLNLITLPYFLFTIIFLAILVLKRTPLWSVMSLVIEPLVRVVVKVLTIPCASVSFISKFLFSNKVRPETPERGLTFQSAVQQGAFGNFPRDYNITKIGEYGELLSKPENLTLFRKLSPHESRLTTAGIRLSTAANSSG